MRRHLGLMPHWLGILVAIAVVIFGVAPLIGWTFSRHGHRIRRGVAMGSILLGVGIPLDPPTRHVVEANERRAVRGDENGDPPEPDVDKPDGTLTFR